MNAYYAGLNPENGNSIEVETGSAPLQLSETIDVDVLQSLMEDFYSLTRMPMALIDHEGTVLAWAGWQNICTRFHRQHPETLCHCVESDTKLTADIREGEYRIYKCMNNMWDAATPVTVGNVHAAYLFTGQFFFDDELPDIELFRAQAVKYGFPEKEYLAAIDDVPRLSRTSVESALKYFTKLATIISQLSYSNGMLARTLTKQELLVHSLEKSRQRLASAQELAHLGSWELDLVSNELSWSDEVYRIFGLEPQAFAATYEAFLQAVHPDDRALVDAAYSESVREGRDRYEIEHRVVRKSGEIRYVHEKCEHFRDETGKIIRSVGMVHDITERSLAESALRESELHYRQIVDSIPGLVFTMTPDGIIEYKNRQLTNFTGVPARALASSGWRNLLHPEDQRRIFAARRAAAKEYAPYDLEHRIRRHDGEYEWFKVRCRPIHNEAGQVVRWFGTAMNIDTLVRAQEDLRQAKAAAESATQAKSEFLANMSHEIRTPMNAIIGLTELTLDTSLSSQQQEYLEMVQSSAESLLKVINDILDFSKIEAGLLEFDLAEFDPGDLAEKTAHTLALRAHQKGLELVCSIDPTVPLALIGDAGRLRQVLINLIGNAIKFTETGEILLRVERVPDQNGCCRLRFSVKDTGIGIPADKIDRLFRYFSQIDNSAARRFDGTGLGLAISQKIVEGMGGSIWVESLEGIGSTFGFTLSFDLAPRDTAILPGDPQPDLEDMRVLVIDDNETNRHILSEMLVGWGMAPTTTASGSEGIRQLRTAAASGKPFRLLLLDEQMPEMDGFAVAEKIRNDHSLPEINIMMLSSGDVPAAIERCRQVGVARYLLKPLRQSELFNILVETFSGPAVTPAGEIDASLPVASLATHSACILLVEDNRINQMLAQTLLQKRGWTVVTAGSGEEALAAWRYQKVDLILMDVQMPGMDGLAATRVIREEEVHREEHTPIIGLTAHAMKGDREICMKAGMDGYVPKPVRAVALYAAVEPWLQNGISVINLRQALKNVNGDRELLDSLARHFVRDCPGARTNLLSAMEAKHFQEIERAAHSLKTVVGIFGAEKSQELLQQLENAAEGREFNEMTWLVPQVAKNLEQIEKSLLIMLPPADHLTSVEQV